MSNLTQKAMAQAVSDLLRTRTLDRITIRDITDACGLTRNTFYYHFHDIYELLKWMSEEKTQEILGGYEAKHDWEGGLRAALDYLYENRQMILHIYESISSDLLYRFINDVMFRHAEVIVSQQMKGHRYSEDALHLTAAFYVNAVVGDVLDWFRSGMDRTPEEMAQMHNILFTGSVKALLASAEKAAAVGRQEK